LVYENVLYNHYLANKAYFSAITVKNVCETFTHKMATKAAGIEITSLSPYLYSIHRSAFYRATL